MFEKNVLYYDNGYVCYLEILMPRNGYVCYEFFREGGSPRSQYFLDTHRSYHGEFKEYELNGGLCRHTLFHHGIDLKVDPTTLTEKDKIYIELSGRLPPRD